MTDDQQDTSMDGGDSGDQGDAPVLPRSVEEVEAAWKYRQSQNDKAHAAETAALQKQIDALKAAPAAPTQETPEQAQVRELQERLAASEQRAAAAQLQVQFPNLASVLGDSITALPPEKLAALETWGDQGQAPRQIMDRNNPPRQQSAVAGVQEKPYSEKTKDELLADLKRATPAYQEALREGLG